MCLYPSWVCAVFPGHTALAVATEQRNEFHIQKESLNGFIILQHLRFISIDVFIMFSVTFKLLAMF